MDDATHAAVAAELLQAHRHRKPIDPVTQTHPEFTLDDAYAVQLAQVRTWIADGHEVQGHKVGLTSAAMQRQLKVDQPDFGHLLDSMFHLDGLPIVADQFISPRAEPEIAFVLKRPLAGPGVNVARALSAVDYVLPALEIIDSRIRDWKIGLIDTVADNASSGGVVLGSRPTRVDAVDLRLSGCVLTRGGDVVGTGAGGAVLGSPVNALVWLANTLGRYGVTLEAGQVVLPGAVTAAVPVVAGDVVTATFHGLGGVTARFTKEAQS
jgi:2-keto-4-pentenoate hydratase